MSAIAEAEKEYPILMKSSLVVASFEGRKTLTMRPISPQPKRKPKTPCKFGAPGTFLWIRETCSIGKAWTKDDHGQVMFFEGPEGAGLHPQSPPDSRSWAREWKKVPSIHMPRWACRLRLEILEVWPMRLQDITEEQARMEGVRIPVSKENGETKVLLNLCSPYFANRPMGKEFNIDQNYFRIQFALEWDEIYGKGPYSWKKNPWVWAIRYKAVPTFKED